MKVRLKALAEATPLGQRAFALREPSKVRAQQYTCGFLAQQLL
jgi:hypothetical protein